MKIVDENREMLKHEHSAENMNEPFSLIADGTNEQNRNQYVPSKVTAMKAITAFCMMAGVAYFGSCIGQQTNDHYQERSLLRKDTPGHYLNKNPTYEESSQRELFLRDRMSNLFRNGQGQGEVGGGSLQTREQSVASNTPTDHQFGDGSLINGVLNNNQGDGNGLIGNGNLINGILNNNQGDGSGLVGSGKVLEIFSSILNREDGQGFLDAILGDGATPVDLALGVLGIILGIVGNNVEEGSPLSQVIGENGVIQVDEDRTIIIAGQALPDIIASISEILDTIIPSQTNLQTREQSVASNTPTDRQFGDGSLINGVLNNNQGDGNGLIGNGNLINGILNNNQGDGNGLVGDGKILEILSRVMNREDGQSFVDAALGEGVTPGDLALGVLGIVIGIVGNNVEAGSPLSRVIGENGVIKVDEDRTIIIAGQALPDVISSAREVLDRIVPTQPSLQTRQQSVPGASPAAARTHSPAP